MQRAGAVENKLEPEPFLEDFWSKLEVGCCRPAKKVGCCRPAKSLLVLDSSMAAAFKSLAVTSFNRSAMNFKSVSTSVSQVQTKGTVGEVTRLTCANYFQLPVFDIVLERLSSLWQKKLLMDHTDYWSLRLWIFTIHHDQDKKEHFRATIYRASIGKLYQILS